MLNMRLQKFLANDGMTAPCKARVIKVFEGKRKSQLEIKIHEGRKREIRRMMEFLEHPVIALRRVAIGPLSLSTLPSGEYRRLTEAEIKRLKTVRAQVKSC